MAIAYTNHVGHAARDKYTGKSTDISTINDLTATEKHNNHDYAPEDVARMQSCIDLDLKKLNKQYEIKNGELVVIEGHLDLGENVRKIYEEQFAAALKAYNEKQIEVGHPERQIQSYIEHISENKQQEVAVEGLIQFGCLEDWENKTLEDREKVVPLLEKCLLDTLDELKGKNSELILAGASLHMNEGSPHIHYVGVPVENTPNAQKGMVKRVRKSAVFTKKSLGTGLQDNVRAKIEPKLKEVFGWEFEKKRAGRNEDLEKRVYVNEKLKEQIREREKDIDTITKQGQEYIDQYREETRELQTNILELQDKQFMLMSSINSIIENEAELLERMIDNTVDNVLINKSGEFNDFCLYMAHCSEEEREELSEKIQKTKENLIRENIDTNSVREGLDAFVKQIEQAQPISWEERQAFWDKYKTITTEFWNVLPELQKEYKAEISKAYNEKYIASQAYYDTLHAIRTTNNLFVMVYMAVKAFFQIEQSRAAESKLNELIKERQELIKNTSNFKGFCNKYREDLKQGKAPNEKYLNRMISLAEHIGNEYHQKNIEHSNFNVTDKGRVNLPEER